MADLRFFLLVNAYFVGLLLVRLAAFFLRARLLVRSRMLGDLRLLWREYWRWRYVPDHIAGLSLSLSTLVAYGALLLLTYGTRGPTVAFVWMRDPALLVLLVCAFVGLGVYAIKESVIQHGQVIELIDALHKLRAFRFAKGALGALKAVDWNWGGARAWLHLGLSTATWISDEVVNQVVDRQVRKALGTILLHLGIDFGLRAAVLVGVLYVAR